MQYSFEFAADVTRLCMDEIRRRGLRESKIFRKSRPINDLFVKVFATQICTKEDLSSIDIHSVATLMQDALWSSQERLIPKKAWRVINYETCTLSNLSSVIDAKSERLLVDILAFLVELMQHKKYNQMDAYKLGDALGKVVMGPADCSTIIAEKAGHFLTRLIIEYAKIQAHQLKVQYASISDEAATAAASISKEVSMPPSLASRSSVDSGISLSASIATPHVEFHQYFARNDDSSACKLQGTKARAKYYDRIILRVKRSSSAWFDNLDGLQAMLDGEYDNAPETPDKPYISIFTTAQEVKQQSARMSPIIYRILMNACRPRDDETAATSNSDTLCFFDERSCSNSAEKQLKGAFDAFRSHSIHTNNILALDEPGEKGNPLKKLNHSLSNLKLNYRKHRSTSQNLNHLLAAEESAITADTEVTAVDPDQQRVYCVDDINEKNITTSAIANIQQQHQQQQQQRNDRGFKMHEHEGYPQQKSERRKNIRPVGHMMKKIMKIAANVGQQEKDRRSSKVVR